MPATSTVVTVLPTTIIEAHLLDEEPRRSEGDAHDGQEGPAKSGARVGPDETHQQVEEAESGRQHGQDHEQASQFGEIRVPIPAVE